MYRAGHHVGKKGIVNGLYGAKLLDGEFLLPIVSHEVRPHSLGIGVDIEEMLRDDGELEVSRTEDQVVVPIPGLDHCVYEAV